MRIGILTYHYAHNYGAVLQCYALQNYLISLGHSVQIIGYENPYILKDYKVLDLHRFKIKNPLALVKKIIHEISYYGIRKGRHNAFNDFINRNLNICSVQEINRKPFDLIIVGSDQVWNYNLTKGFDSFYWGDFPHPTNTVLATYAVSMHDSWPSEVDVELQKRIVNFKYISVREEKLAKKILKIVPSIKVNVVIDPTLLFKATEWDEIAIKPDFSKPYLLLYQVDPNPIAEETACMIAEERNLQIFRLFAQPDKPHSPEVATTSPQQFVGLFKYASFVVCSSFHGTVFSILYKNPFYTVKVLGKSSRVETLLSVFGLEDRLISLKPSSITEVDYSRIPADIAKQSECYINEIVEQNA